MHRIARTRIAAGIAAAGLALAALLLPQSAEADIVTSSIPVGTGSLSSALSADGSRLYVGSFSGANTGAVTVVDTATGASTTVPTGGNQIVDLALNASGNRLYTAHRAGAVRAIDTATNTVLATATPGPTAYGIALSPDGSRLFVSDFQNARVLVLDSTTLAQVAPPIPVGPNPRAIVLSPDGTRAYVADQGASTLGSPGSVSVIDVATNSLVTTVPTGGNGTWSVQPTPDGAHVYAVNGGSNTITVIDAATNTVVKTISTPTPGSALSQPYQLRFTPDGTRAYVSNQLGNSVSVIDTHAASVVSTIPVGTNPTAVRITSDGLTAYVANQASNTVSVIALDTAPAITTTALPDGVAGTAYSSTVAGSGRPAPTLAVSSGSLPPGLTLASDGTLAGTPTAAGTFTFTVTASSLVSGIPTTAQRTLSVTVAPAPAVLVAADDDFAPTAVPAGGGVAGDVLGNDTFNGAPVTATDVTLSLTDNGGISGATLAVDGSLTIPAGAAAGTHALAYQECLAADPQNCDSATVTVRVLAPVVAPPAPPSGSEPVESVPAAARPAPALATTGSNLPAPLLAAAAGTLIAGAGLLAIRRSKRDKRLRSN